jgi:hypothetical protein
MKTGTAFLLALAAATAFCAAAAADGADAKTPAGGSSRPFFGLSAGAKGSFGGNYLTPPDDVPPGALLYDDGAGGVGGGGGLYVELRALRGHLGLELDVLFEGNKNWSNIEFNDVVKTDWIYRFKTVRVPLLLEGSVENDLVRGSLGFGPEFVVGTGASTGIEVTEGGAYVDAASLDAQRDRFTAAPQTDTFLCAAFGLGFKVWRLVISLDLRYAYNVTQPKGYLDRLRIAGTGADAEQEVVASSTMDLRLLLGVGYDVAFGDF